MRDHGGSASRCDARGICRTNSQTICSTYRYRRSECPRSIACCTWSRSSGPPFRVEFGDAVAHHSAASSSSNSAAAIGQPPRRPARADQPNHRPTSAISLGSPSGLRIAGSTIWLVGEPFGFLEQRQLQRLARSEMREQAALRQAGRLGQAPDRDRGKSACAHALQALFDHSHSSRLCFHSPNSTNVRAIRQGRKFRRRSQVVFERDHGSEEHCRLGYAAFWLHDLAKLRCVFDRGSIIVEIGPGRAIRAGVVE
jgi:hypothetical protein